MQMKVDSGADFLITQLFFDNRFYLDLVRRAKEAGITIPIVPGLMPVPSRRSLAFMAAMTRAPVPPGLAPAMDQATDDGTALTLGPRHSTYHRGELRDALGPGP